MASATASIRYRFGRFDLQPAERRLQVDGEPVHLGSHAFDVLVALVERAGHLVTKQALLAHVWAGVVVEENSLQAQLSALRKVLGPDAIATVRGQGYRFDLSVLPVTAPPAATAQPKTNLPPALTSFIGREKEIAEIRGWLGAVRLLTLTGAGGCGKTRLALQVAGGVLSDYADGVWLVELAPLADARLVASAVVKVLALQPASGQDPVEALLDWIGPRRLLLILDNAEHLLEPCAELADRLLRRCAGLVLLVTSRERLGVDGELTYRVPSLSVPEGDTDEAILTCEAVRLFVDRARLQRPTFEVTHADAASLAIICRRLDGIALAIELAAPRVRMMTLEELSQRIEDRFQVLTDGSRAALPRHRTLRSLIDWSHALLSPPERAMLRRASVFAGGWTLAAAEQVCRGQDIDSGDGMHLLTSLLDKSLVDAATHQDETRFRMLETVHHYARDQLRDSGEEAQARDRHASYLIGLAAGLDSQRDIDILSALRRLDPEQDNLRAALAWCESAPGRVDTGLRLAGLLVQFWQTRGNYSEGNTWLGRLLAAAPPDAHGDAYAMALQGRGALMAFDGDQTAAEALLEQAVALWRQLDNRSRLAATLANLGEVRAYAGDPTAARALCEEALAIGREANDLRSISFALAVMGQSALTSGDHAAAQALLEQCLAVARVIGPWNTAATLTMYSVVRQEHGDLAGSQAALRESLQGFSDFGDRGGVTYVRMQLAKVTQDLGDLPAARVQLRQASDTLPPGQYNELLEWLDLAAGMLNVPGHALDAARIWGCVKRHREERAILPLRPARLERLRQAARHALQDDASFDGAWEEGRSWSLETAAQHARPLLLETGRTAGQRASS